MVRYSKGTVGAEVEAIERLSDGVDVLARRPAGSTENDVLIVSVGAMSELALDVSNRLGAQGISSTVVDPRWVLPVRKSIIALASHHRLVICIEDGVRAGGVGSRIRQEMRAAGVDTALNEVGLPVEFLDHGTRSQVLERVGLTAQQITHDVVAQVLGTKVPFARPLPGPGTPHHGQPAETVSPHEATPPESLQTGQTWWWRGTGNGTAAPTGWSRATISARTGTAGGSSSGPRARSAHGPVPPSTPSPMPCCSFRATGDYVATFYDDTYPGGLPGLRGPRRRPRLERHPARDHRVPRDRHGPGRDPVRAPAACTSTTRTSSPSTRSSMEYPRDIVDRMLQADADQLYQAVKAQHAPFDGTDAEWFRKGRA